MDGGVGGRVDDEWMDGQMVGWMVYLEALTHLVFSGYSLSVSVYIKFVFLVMCWC